MGYDEKTAEKLNNGSSKKVYMQTSTLRENVVVKCVRKVLKVAPTAANFARAKQTARRR